MYCPKCSQRQPTDDVRFCTRCGLSLSGVAELLAADGALVRRPAGTGDQRLSPRQKGVRMGALLMLTCSLIALVQALMPSLIDKLVVLAAPVIIGFFVGFVRLLYALFFEEKEVNSGAGLAPRHGAAELRGTPAAALPPRRDIPVADWTRRPDTAEMAQPLSVAERTTELLKHDSGALGG